MLKIENIKLAPGELLRFVQASDIQRAVARMEHDTGEAIDK